MNTTDIDKIIKQLRKKQEEYKKSCSYYDGDHDLAFASEKFKNAFGELFREFALNLCPAVVDALRDKLKITKFTVEEGSEKIADEAWKIWQQNRMGRRAGEIHKEAIKTGDAYAIAWVDGQNRVTIYPQKGASCTVVYDEETPGKIVLAGKYWTALDKKIRLNLYYPDRTEKYISEYDAGYGLYNSAGFQPYTAEGSEIVENPHGIVPVFHFPNNADIGDFGISELKDAVPVQDGLNKSVLDMLVAMEYVSFPQRFATGIEIDYDEKGEPIPPFKVGIDKLVYTENPDAKFGSFESADLEQFLKVKADFRIDMACVTGTPLYYFMLTSGEVPSGEALKKSETRFIQKIADRQEAFGDVWEDVMQFALGMENKKSDTRLITAWDDPAPISEKEELENIASKKDLGISEEQALKEAGYGEADIERMKEEKAAARDAFIRDFNAGNESVGDDVGA